MMDKLKFETFEEFCNRAEEILYEFKKIVELPNFKLLIYKDYIYNHHTFSKIKRIDMLAKDKCWIWLMSYKYEKIDKNDLYCTLGAVRKAQLKK